MKNTIVAIACIGMPEFAGVGMSAVGFVPSAHVAAEAYTRLGAARNGAQGASDAWSPPV